MIENDLRAPNVHPLLSCRPLSSWLQANLMGFVREVVSTRAFFAPNSIGCIPIVSGPVLAKVFPSYCLSSKESSTGWNPLSPRMYITVPV